MSAPKKHVVFDVVGTCVTYDSLVSALDARLGVRLREHCIAPFHLINTWIEAAERECTYLGLSGRPTSFDACVYSLFYRALWLAGIPKPREFASDEDLQHIMEAYAALPPREGVEECFRVLREGGFEVWGFTMGDQKRVAGYFERAGVELAADKVLSCDGEDAAKPALEAYQGVLRRFGGEEAWFAAAHMWDVSSARLTGWVVVSLRVLILSPLLDLPNCVILRDVRVC